jgi:hypothetical protein
MLDPQDRHLYLEALQPPTGYGLDRAVGTTFSLDLMTLLMVPLSFALMDWEDASGQPRKDPVALLDALRRYADRTLLFCQSGRIAAPTSRHLLFSHLERMVIQVQPPQAEGVFHPKVWVLRFTAPGAPVIYRVLCLSRNLTTDRSWDTLLSLEGMLTERTNAYARNRPLAHFVKALPGMAQEPLSAAQLEAVEHVADELLRVQFKPPAPFEDELTFWPLGIPGYTRFPMRDEPMDRLLVISPFVRENVLQKRLKVPGRRILISRAEELDKLKPGALEGYEVYVLAEGAEPEPGPEADAGPSAAQAPRDTRGLHAKLYIAERGWDATLWTGSANATNAAFEANVELLIQLRGKRKQMGIEPLLNPAGGLSRLLQPYTPSAEGAAEDPEGQRNEERLEALRRELSRAGLRLQASPAAEGTGYDLALRGALPAGLLDGVKASVWPVSLKPAHALDLTPLTQGQPVSFASLSAVSLTAFLEVTLETGADESQRALHFVLNLPLEGAPADRLERILREVIGSRGQLLRYLLFLLARQEDALLAGERLLHAEPEGKNGSGSLGGEELPLLEELLRTLSRAPGQLDAVQRLIADLEKTPEGRELLPPGFSDVWTPIWRARQEVR